jgi:hypothetical protein
MYSLLDGYIVYSLTYRGLDVLHLGKENRYEKVTSQATNLRSHENN